MQIRLQFDDERIQRYDARGANPHFTFYLEHDGSCFPEEGWADFGLVVIGWWVLTLDSLASGSEPQGELMFMDGPFSLQATLEASGRIRLAPKGGKPTFVLPLQSFANEVLAAVEKITTHLRRLGVRDQECKALTEAAQRLRTTLVNAREP